MKTLLTVGQLEERLPAATLPLAEDGETLDTKRIEIALGDATGIIVAQLPWLLDEDTGDLRDDIPPQFDRAVRSFRRSSTRPSARSARTSPGTS